MLKGILESIKRYCAEHQSVVQISAVGILLFSIIGAGILVSFMASGNRSLSGFFTVDRKGALSNSRAAELAALVESASTPVKTCSFETSLDPVHAPIIINEVAWMGNKESANNEWIELKNISQKAVDMSGWQIVNGNERVKAVISHGETIAPGGFYLLQRGNSNFLPGIRADGFFSGAIRNNNEALRLFNADCFLIDEVFANASWPGGDNKTKATMERNSKTLAWYTSLISGGTPKQENTRSANSQNNSDRTEDRTSDRTDDRNDQEAYSHFSSDDNGVERPSLATGSQAQPDHAVTWCSPNSSKTLSRAVLINEVAWAGTKGKSTHEWIELKNNSSSTVSLNGWQLQNASQSIKVSFGSTDSLKAGGFYLLKRGSDDFLPTVKADAFFTGAIKNSDEILRLFDVSCNVVDEVVADTGKGAQWPAGTASPDYRTAERSNDLSWHTYSGSGKNGVMGTPRANNSLPFTSESSPSSESSSAASLNQSQPESSPPQQTVKVLINSVRIYPTQERYIELYNPNDFKIDMSGWYIQRKTSTATSFTSLVSKTHFQSKFIEARGHLVIARAVDDADIVISNLTLTDSNTIQIKNQHGETVDKVGWGNAQDFEGQAAPEPAVGETLERKLINGIVQDTDNNAFDFIVK